MAAEIRKRLRVAVLVSKDPSDIFFANQLMKRLYVVGVLVENQSKPVPAALKRMRKLAAYSASPGRLVKRIKDEITAKRSGRRVAEITAEGFGEDGVVVKAPSGVRVSYTSGVCDINSSDNVEFVKGLRPDVIAVCGTSILKPPMIGLAPSGCLNLHGGLSQWYRGVWTTMWAVHNEEPEYVGCTVHFVSRGVDDGDIVYQGRPEIEEDDNHETLYVKVVKLGTGLMIKAISDMEAGTLERHPLETRGRLYLNRMVTPEVIDEVWKKVDSGLIRNYVRRRGSMDGSDEIAPLLKVKG